MNNSGALLRAARIEAGVGLGAVARESGRSKGHLSRVERGEREVTPSMILGYERAIGQSLDHIPFSTTEEIRCSSHSEPEESDMRRRHLLSAIISGTTGIAATGAIEAVTGALQSPIPIGELDPFDWVELENAALSLTSRDLNGGGFAMVTEGKALLDWSIKVLSQTKNNSSRQKLASVAGYLADRCGWAVFNLGHHQAADRLFGVALRLAAEARDDNLHAQVLSDMASHAVFRGKPAEALTYTQVLSDDDRVISPLKSALFGVTAEAYGHMGDERNAERYITAAIETSQQGTEENAPVWLPTFRDGSGLTYGSAQAAYLLFQSTNSRNAVVQALELNTSAMSSLASSRGRSALLCAIRTSIVELSAGDRERGITLAGSLPPASSAIRSTRVQRDLHKLRALIPKEGAYDEVREHVNSFSQRSR